MPKISNEEISRATKLLDSVAVLIREKKMTFEEAALKFSDDPGKINGGRLVNPETGNTGFTLAQLGRVDQKLPAIVEKMNAGDISRPVTIMNEEGKQTFQILYLVGKTQAHVANLKEDYNTIQEWALNKKKGETIDKWITEKISKTYFRINPAYQDCNLIHNWEIK
jgi:peptidyl-prolyl cis-trans isomerase SurA